MKSRDDLQHFLTSRRAKISPEQAGLQSSGRRRVPGLRREEVALLARISVDYYSRLERGTLKRVPEAVMASVARALQFDDAEERRLRDLIRVSGSTSKTSNRRAKQSGINQAVQQILDALGDLPAAVHNGRLDIVAANRMGRALFCDQLESGVRPANHARFTFLDPRGRAFAPDWEQAASEIVAILRAEARKDPHDPELIDLIG